MGGTGAKGYGPTPVLKGGEQFGKLLVLKLAPDYRIPKTANRKYVWYLCRCDCGREEVVAQYRFFHQSPKTHCGCANKTLGTYFRYEYNSWSAMIARCQDPKHASYKEYGGRGITVCERWQKFENFLEDLGRRPEGLSLDRINADGPYDPTNCRWATKDTQSWNKRKSLYLISPLSGKVEPAGKIAKDMGVSYQTMRYRMMKEGKWIPQPKPEYDEIAEQPSSTSYVSSHTITPSLLSSSLAKSSGPSTPSPSSTESDA